MTEVEFCDQVAGIQVRNTGGYVRAEKAVIALIHNTAAVRTEPAGIDPFSLIQAT